MTWSDQEFADPAEETAIAAFERSAAEVFPSLGHPEDGDAGLIEQLSNRAVSHIGASGTAAGLGATAKVLVIVVTVIAVATVATVFSSENEPTSTQAAAVDRPAGEHPLEPRAADPPATGPITAEKVPIEDPGASEIAPSERKVNPAPTARRASGAGSERSVDGAPATAADLLRQGNEARRAGDYEGARAKYRELRRRFPQTREDVLVRVSLGQLELQHFANPTAAVEQFDAYLREKTRGNLAEEALLGKIAALRRLGRRDAERQALQELIADFPGSLHVQEARQRLDELSL